MNIVLYSRSIFHAHRDRHVPVKVRQYRNSSPDNWLRDQDRTANTRTRSLWKAGYWGVDSAELSRDSLSKQLWPMVGMVAQKLGIYGTQGGCDTRSTGLAALNGREFLVSGTWFPARRVSSNCTGACLFPSDSAVQDWGTKPNPDLAVTCGRRAEVSLIAPVSFVPGWHRFCFLLGMRNHEASKGGYLNAMSSTASTSRQAGMARQRGQANCRAGNNAGPPHPEGSVRPIWDVLEPDTRQGVAGEGAPRAAVCAHGRCVGTAGTALNLTSETLDRKRKIFARTLARCGFQFRARLDSGKRKEDNMHPGGDVGTILGKTTV